jgi:non-specific serine/threonine protein kinase/serine/threonine-protein kinase
MPDDSELESSGLEDTLAVPPRIAPDPAPEPSVENRIGPYRLLEVIGEGGMGEVWLAEQLEPRRKVALKLIKAGMDTKQVVARFDSERQALALMDHPAIAKVFDGGSTPEGRPYFVMEYVPGIPIHHHCDDHKLSTRARLELFIEVCDGVQHAHQKAIIHRDLKPSNILVSMVDGKAQVKIIDFGIAKATGSRLTDKTLFTELGAIIGTPEYMSPEQADLGAQDIDTRTDVYALGVVLYQLLTGELPFASHELRSSSYEELRRKLKEIEPPRPSTKLSTLGDAAASTATNRDTDPGALRHQLAGDLDAITMKALEKERDRRYGTPSELAQDIGRHLRNEPVVARPASTAYRVRKYIKRHRVGVGLAAGLAVLLVGFAVAMGVQARRTALERDRANREREASDKVAAFLGNMISSSAPEALGEALWKDLRQRVGAARRADGASEAKVAATLASLDDALTGVSPTQTAVHLLDQQILERAGKTVVEEMGSEPRIAGKLEYTLTRTYENLGLYKQAEQHAQRAVELRTRALGPGHPETLEAMSELANVLVREGQFAQAEKLHRELLDLRTRTLGPDHRDTLLSMHNLGIVAEHQGRYTEAEKLTREAWEAEKRVLGPEHPDTLKSMSNLALDCLQLGRYQEAEKLGRDLVEILRRVKGPTDPFTLGAMNNLALVMEAQGHYADAEKLGRELMEAQRKVLGPSHPDALDSMSNLAVVLVQLGRYPEAEKLLQEALETSRNALGPEHPSTLLATSNLGGVYRAQGRFREAAKLLEANLEAERRVLGPEHPDTLGTTYSLADTFNDLSRHNEARALALEAVTGYERTKFDEEAPVGGAQVALGRALTGLKRYPEAEAALLKAEQLLSKVKGMQRKSCLEALVALYTESGDSTQAASWKAKLGQ